MTAHVLQFAEPSRARYELRSWGEFALFDRTKQQECTPRGRKACAIVAYLASLGSERVNRERLTALLWSERGEEQARASLRQALLELKPLSNGDGDLLAIDRGYVRLNPLLLTSDGAMFQSDAESGNIDGLCAALRDRSGELFTGLDGVDPAFDEWLAVERRRENERLLAVGTRAAAQGLELGVPGPVRDLVASLQELDPTDEDVARLGMLADHASGNLPAVHRRYQQLSQDLSRELDVAPSVETQALFQRLSNGSAEGKIAVASTEAAPAALAGNAEEVAAPPSAFAAPLASDQAAAALPLWRRKWTRRAAAGGIVAAGAGVALTYAAWDLLPRYSPDPRAAALFQRGQQAFAQAQPDTIRQAVELYKQAVAIDPDYADAWAELAYTYSLAMCDCDDFSKGERGSIPRLVKEAAGRALALDPDNAKAHLALALPFFRYRQWLGKEQQFRQITRRFPEFFAGHAMLAMLLQEVGRLEDSLIARRREIELEPIAAFSWFNRAFALHCLGRDHEALKVLDEGATRFPAHPGLWRMRYTVLVGGKRYSEAASFARDPRGRPRMIPEAAVREFSENAEALATGIGKEAIIAKYRAMRKVNIESVPGIVPIIAELGGVDMAFDGLEYYFFGGTRAGQVFSPPGPTDPRDTSVLFTPPMVALRDDPRYASILRRTGLEDYWRKSGTQPDFRGRRTAPSQPS